jgi:hypothetical protein
LNNENNINLKKEEEKEISKSNVKAKIENKIQEDEQRDDEISSESLGDGLSDHDINNYVEEDEQDESEQNTTYTIYVGKQELNMMDDQYSFVFNRDGLPVEKIYEALSLQNPKVYKVLSITIAITEQMIVYILPFEYSSDFSRYLGIFQSYDFKTDAYTILYTFMLVEPEAIPPDAKNCIKRFNNFNKF